MSAQSQKKESTDLSSHPPSNKIRFSPKGDFAQTLRQREADFFSSQQLSRHDHPLIYLKTLILFLWLGTSYALLLASILPLWGKILSAVALGTAMAGIGFNVMHDGGHRSYSKHAWINRWMFYSLDLLGGNSYYWHWKHNHLHHAYTNIDHHDTDLEVGYLGRLSPHQKHFWFHRFQHLYMWFFYGLLTIKWQLFDDYYNLAVGKVGSNPVPRPKGWDLLHLFLGKMTFYFFAFALPLYFYHWTGVLAFYVLASFVEGVILAVVFQMAHCLEEATFPAAPTNNERIEQDWFQHQLATTVNFSPKSRILSWYCGGLNYQIEHHLFPKVTHIHYPMLSQIVQQTCEEHNVPYHCHKTLWKSLRSHYRWLKTMGSSPQS